jgi:DNA-binding NarL/FixJ family response regulator
MADSNEVLKALHAVADGHDYFAREVSELVLTNYSKYHKEDEKKEQSLVTKREKEIIALIAEGLTYKKIAEKLYISQFTVINHRQNIMQKLKLNSNAELIRFAIENGLVKSDSGT